MREPDEANCAESVSGMTTSVRHKLAIRDVTHHLKKGCTSSGNKEPLGPLLRRVIIRATAMKEAYEKPAPTLMNLIQEAQCVLKIEIALNNRGLSQAEKTL